MRKVKAEPRIGLSVRFSLRTLLIVAMLGGPALAAMWWWPSLLVLFGSTFMTLAVALGTFMLHGWQTSRMQKRLALGTSSASAAGMELSVILCFVATTVGTIYFWVEHLVPRLAN
jgi:hypothetical protein